MPPAGSSGDRAIDQHPAGGGGGSCPVGPLLVGGLLIGIFTISLNDRRLEVADKPPWSLRQLVGTFYVSPRANPDFAWAFTSRFMLIMAYAFLVTYQTYYLIDEVGVPEGDVAHQIYLGTLAQSAALIVASPLTGRLSDRVQKRKIFVIAAAVIYAVALLVIATAGGTGGYLLGMALGGLGFGMYMAVDLALVVEVLPDTGSAAKDLGVLNIAGALPFALAPALAPALLGITGNSFSALYLMAGGCALLGAASIVPIRRVD